jgi:regulator of protease activity HflC (stomatin/prohibitin superfamily)
MYFVLLGIGVFILILVIANIRLVQQSTARIVERLGGYQATWNVGIHILVPFADRVAKTVSLKEQVADFRPQPVITKDNVTIMVDTVVFYQITDPKLYTYGVEKPVSAIENLSATTLRNIIGELELDGTLTSRDMINNRMRSVLDEATDPWGIKVNRVELKNIEPPTSIKEAMEKQMRAERERRAAILVAEGEKQAQILKSEGIKASVILQAEAKKASTILDAEASKEAAIRLAEGEAQAIIAVQKATADGLSLLKAVGVDDGVIKLKSLEALQKVADGQSTKIIIPSEIQNLAGLVTSITEVIKT